MKKWYLILKIVLWCVIGVFAGSSIYQVYDYMKRPGLYMMNSAPWYLSIVVNGLMTAAVVVVLLIFMKIIKKMNKK